MAFLNCNSVTNSASAPVWDPLLLTVSAACPAAFTVSALRDLCWTGLHQWDCTEEPEAFQKKVYLGEKTLTELSCFHGLCFFDLSLFIFFFLFKKNSLRPSLWSSCRKLSTDMQWLSFTEHNVSRVLCRNSDITVEQLVFSHFHSSFSLKWHESQLLNIWTKVVCLVQLV